MYLTVLIITVLSYAACVTFHDVLRSGGSGICYSTYLMFLGFPRVDLSENTACSGEASDQRFSNAESYNLGGDINQTKSIGKPLTDEINACLTDHFSFSPQTSATNMTPTFRPLFLKTRLPTRTYGTGTSSLGPRAA